MQRLLYFNNNVILSTEAVPKRFLLSFQQILYHLGGIIFPTWYLGESSGYVPVLCAPEQERLMCWYKFSGRP